MAKKMSDDRRIKNAGNWAAHYAQQAEKEKGDEGKKGLELSKFLNLTRFNAEKEESAKIIAEREAEEAANPGLKEAREAKAKAAKEKKEARYAAKAEWKAQKEADEDRAYNALSKNGRGLAQIDYERHLGMLAGQAGQWGATTKQVNMLAWLMFKANDRLEEYDGEHLTKTVASRNISDAM